MIDTIKAFHTASAVELGSEPHQLAEAIAIVRDGAPYSLKQTPHGMLPHWQAIVFEMLLMNVLSQYGGR